MKKSFLLYLFILSVLLTLYTYVFLSKEVKFEQENAKRSITKLKDSLKSMESKMMDSQYFDLSKNEMAQQYFAENPFGNIDNLVSEVQNKLLDYNENAGGNPYTGQVQLGTNKFVINKIKVLNQRWIIADFSDGKIWGDVILKYFVDKDKKISFEVVQSILHTEQ